jgi:hypothetical protein
MNDTDRGDTATERAARRYAALLRLYPAEHRRTFGDQMLRTFKDQYRDMQTQGEIGLSFWLAVIGDAIRSSMKERAMALKASRIVDAVVVTTIISLGNILLFPQGIVALLFSIFHVDVRSWFVALYLPQPYQVPVCLVSITLGLTQLYAGWSIVLKQCTQWDSVGDAIRARWQK